MTVFGIEISMTLIWLIAAIVFFIAEALTAGLATIWFAAGSVAAMLISFLDVSAKIQAAVFVVVSFGLLIFTRKIFVEKLRAGTEKTNINALLGKKGIVISPVMPYAVGQVKVGGQVWSAASKNPEDSFEEGQLVTISAIEGVKLIITASEEA